jgi:PAP2 superfamily
MQDSVRRGAQGPTGTFEIETAQLAVSSPDVTLTSRFGPLVRVVYREHRILLAMVAAYVAIGGSFLVLFGRPYPLRLTYPLFALMWVVGGGSYVFLQWGRHPRNLRATIEPSRVAGALLVGALFVPFQVTFQSLKIAIGHFVGFPWDAPLARVDEVLHGGPAWHLVSSIIAMPRVMNVTMPIYQAGWTCVLFVFLVWLAWSHDRVLRMRGLLSLILAWIVGGTMLAWIFASAGPCFSSEPQYRELIARFDSFGFILADLQRQHWAAQQDQLWSPFAGVSAFPSMHVTVAVLMAIVVSARSRRVGLAFWTFAIFVQVWSVVLGWHYAIDGYAGGFIAAGCWRLGGLLVPKEVD